MRRRLALIPILVLLPLAACSGRTDNTTAGAAPAGTTAAPTVAATPTSKSETNAPAKPTPTTTNVPNVAKARPSGSGNPAWGTQYAILKSSNLSTRQITYDLIEWYDGEEAVKACAEDGEKPAENSYCEGWYIRNNNKKLRTLTVYPGARIRMNVTTDYMKSVDLKTFLSKVDPGNVIRFDIDANRIMKLDHIYLP
jgi:hypothetical protein